MKAAVIFPHQLFRENPCFGSNLGRAYLIEEPLFFRQFCFHKKKIVLHRASMKFYADWLEKKGIEACYIESSRISETSSIPGILLADGVSEAVYCDPVDDWAEGRFRKACEKEGVSLLKLDTPAFINSSSDISISFPAGKRYSFTDFYRRERLRQNILMEGGKPRGGKLSFDSENRKKLPKKIWIPQVRPAKESRFLDEAIEYTNREFQSNYGDAENFQYPVDFEGADRWLKQFFEERFAGFGEFEDAISSSETFLFHSAISPMLNCGLLTPGIVASRAIAFAERNNIPINSLEGFIRQLIGWREFIRGTYETIGRKQRCSNFWGHKRKLPEKFWRGETGLAPLDTVIKRVLENAYCHHIERLMILGNFMLLCETSPDDAYRWFMEMFIDSYDWVMVGNVYSMSQFADGGLTTTKPYISGSNYIKKMSDFQEGSWCEIWDGLYWRFIAANLDFFAGNPRLSVMPLAWARMSAEKREKLINTAENFLTSWR